MDFIYLLRILFKRKWIIIGATVLAAAIAYFFTGNKGYKYRSYSQISTGFTISGIQVTDEEFDIYQAQQKFNNTIVTMTSPSVLSLLSYALILHDLDSSGPFRVLTESQKASSVYKNVKLAEAKKLFQNRLDNMSLLTSYKPEEKKLIELLRLYGYDHRMIGNALNVYRLQTTDYLQIDYSSENPELSAYVVNNLFQQFIRYYKSVRSNTSQESIDTLKSLMDKKKLELDFKNALLRGDNAIDIGMQNTSTFDLISSFEQSLAIERSKQTNLYSELRKVQQRLASIGVIVQVDNTANNAELLMLKEAMENTYKQYLQGGSKDQALLNRYNQLKTEYQSKVGKTTPSPKIEKTNETKEELLLKKSDIEIDIQTCNSNMGSLQSKINQLKGSAQADATRGVNAETLAKDAELANKEYLAAKQKYNDAIDMSSSSVNSFRQILPGQPAISPEPSKRKMIVAMAGIAAFLMTILVIILLAYLDSSVKTPGIFAKMVNLKLISMVNFMNLKNKNLADIVANKSGGDNILDVENKRHNVFRESLRKLRYEVEKSGKKTFLFASTKKNQGKTTLIQALSYSLSQSKKKVLIIDTNFVNNDLTVELGASPILEKMNTSKTNLDSIIDQVRNSSTTITEGSIYAIGSEGGDYTPSEILPRENLLHHLKELTIEFDYIFLEAPPLNDFSDAKELSMYVEGVIAVFSATDIIKQIDKESITFFKELDGKFVGAILNMVDLKNVNVA